MSGSGGAVLPLHNPVQHYAWGSTTAIPDLLSREPDGRPWAELWLGAHPMGCSVAAGRPLSDVVADDPAAALGPRALERFGPRLPYLLKVLAVESSLSLQAHPGSAQAAAGFADEERRGLPPGDPARRFVDPFHKPEMVVALTPFEALVGFRPAADSATLLAGLRVPELEPYVAELAGRPDHAGLRGTVESIFRLPADDLHRLTAAVAATADHAPPTLSVAVRLAAEHPGDPGALVALLMGRVVLNPGEALFLPAGVLHSYQHGLAVEAMAASDNVLRGGLTKKPVHVDGLLAALSLTETAALRVVPRAVGAGVLTYDADVREFALTRVDAHGPAVEVPGSGPRLLLCTEGGVEVRAGGVSAGVRRGHAVFVPDAAGTVAVAGSGTAWHMSTGDGAPG